MFQDATAKEREFREKTGRAVGLTRGNPREIHRPTRVAAQGIYAGGVFCSPGALEMLEPKPFATFAIFC